jgi:hypothetical protein
VYTIFIIKGGEAKKTVIREEGATAGVCGALQWIGGAIGTVAGPVGTIAGVAAIKSILNCIIEPSFLSVCKETNILISVSTS